MKACYILSLKGGILLSTCEQWVTTLRLWCVVISRKVTSHHAPWSNPSFDPVWGSDLVRSLWPDLVQHYPESQAAWRDNSHSRGTWAAHILCRSEKLWEMLTATLQGFSSFWKSLLVQWFFFSFLSARKLVVCRAKQDITEFTQTLLGQGNGKQLSPIAWSLWFPFLFQLRM